LRRLPGWVALGAALVTLLNVVELLLSSTAWNFAAPTTLKPPKKAKNSFFLFAADVRPEMMKTEEGKGKKASEVAKLIGAAWKKLSEKEVAKYKKKAEKDKERYKKELAAFFKKGGVLPEKTVEVLSAKSKKKTAPSAYEFYVKENLSAALASLKKGEESANAFKKVAKDWKALSEKKKKPYVEQSAKAKAELAAA